MLIHLACKDSIAFLLVKKVDIFEEYTNFLDIFSKKSASIFSHHLNINKYMINLKASKQLTYELFYSLSLV